MSETFTFPFIVAFAELLISRFPLNIYVSFSFNSFPFSSLITFPSDDIVNLLWLTIFVFE